MEAPRVLSMLTEPEQTAAFLAELQAHAPRVVGVYVDLGPVEELSLDAIVAMSAVLKSHPGLRARGCEPRHAKARDFFQHSGFYNFFKRSGGRDTAPAQSAFQERTSRRVEARTARKLIEFATTRLEGKARFHKGSQRIFVESMANTHEHSGAGGRTGTWWAGAHGDTEAGRLSFVLVDSGVGIFNSAKVARLLSAARGLGLVDNRYVLSELLHGRIGSSTGFPWRGKGLPAIREVLERGEASRIVIATGDVWYDVGPGTGRLLNAPFGGTLIAWEVRP